MEKSTFTLPHKIKDKSVQTKSRHLLQGLITVSGRLFVIFALFTMCYLLWARDLWSTQERYQGDVFLAFALVCTVLVYSFFSKENRDSEKQMLRMKTVSIATKAGVIELMPRDEWRAEPPRNKLEMLKKPVDYVIISHSADISKLDTTPACAEAVRKLQQLGFQMGFDDIAFNYLVGNDGVIYEGRGHSYVSASAKDWNKKCIGVGFLGKYIEKLPSLEALDACKSFLQYLVDEGILSPNFTIHGLCQIRAKFPDAPGAKLYQEIQTWKGTENENTWSWQPSNLATKVHPSEETFAEI